MMTEILLTLTVVGERIEDWGERALDDQRAPFLAAVTLWLTIGILFGFMA